MVVSFRWLKKKTELPKLDQNMSEQFNFFRKDLKYLQLSGLRTLWLLQMLVTITVYTNN